MLHPLSSYPTLELCTITLHKSLDRASFSAGPCEESSKSCATEIVPGFLQTFCQESAKNYQSHHNPSHPSVCLTKSRVAFFILVPILISIINNASPHHINFLLVTVPQLLIKGKRAKRKISLSRHIFVHPHTSTITRFAIWLAPSQQSLIQNSLASPCSCKIHHVCSHSILPRLRAAFRQRKKHDLRCLFRIFSLFPPVQLLTSLLPLCRVGITRRKFALSISLFLSLSLSLSLSFPIPYFYLFFSRFDGKYSRTQELAHNASIHYRSQFEEPQNESGSLACCTLPLQFAGNSCFLFLRLISCQVVADQVLRNNKTLRAK